MKDGIPAPEQNPPHLSPNSEPRLPYVEPQLTVFGDLAALTKAVGSSGRSDGGTQFGMMSSGV